MQITNLSEVNLKNSIVQKPGNTSTEAQVSVAVQESRGFINAQQNENEITRGVTLDISQNALDMYLERLRENQDNQDDAALDLAKIMEIARRISNGDKVPASDEKKLLEHSFELYQTAKSAAMLNQDRKRKEYDALFEEDEDGVTREKLRELNRYASEGSPVPEGVTPDTEASAKVVISEE